MKDLLRSTMAQTVVLGIVSFALYALLFAYAETLVRLATETPRGNAFYAVVPIAIAFIFSLVHGSFTGAFWDVVGLKANHTPHKK